MWAKRGTHLVQGPVPLAPDAEREEQHPQLVAHVAVVDREVVAQLVACRTRLPVKHQAGTDLQTPLVRTGGHVARIVLLHKTLPGAEQVAAIRAQPEVANLRGR